MTIDIKSISWGVNPDGGYIQIGVDNPQIAVSAVESVENGKQYEVDIRKKRKKRSLDANGYCWQLIGRLAAAVHLPPEEVYRAAIRDVGGNYEILPIKAEAVNKFISAWCEHGIGWLCDCLGESKIDGYVNVRATTAQAYMIPRKCHG